MRRVDEFESLRAEGMTYKQIAALCGCSYQNVAQMMAKYDADKFMPVSKNRCIYDGLRNWMNKNRVGNSEIIRMRNGQYTSGNAAAKLRRQLRGEQLLKKDDIDFFRELTGLTYEELFVEVSDG